MAIKLTKKMYQEVLEDAGFRVEEIFEITNIRPTSIERGHRSVLWAVARK